jgi:4-aminobutyrate aminotransferase/(S)-3-amino-2-methylpropionate transaminase
LAVLDVIEKEQLCDKSMAIGQQIRDWAEALQRETNCIGDIRTTGAMSAIELVKNGDADRPDAELTKQIAAEALQRGVIMLTCGSRGNVVRFLSPLTIGKETLGEALEIIGGVIRELTSEVRKAG